MLKWVVCFALLPSVSYAQPTKLDPTSLAWNNKRDANIISNVSVATSIALDTWDSFHSFDKKRAFIKQGERTLILLTTAEITKRITNRTRPDNSNNLSFFSEHTGFAAMNQKWQISIPLMTSTGYLRMAADKHYLTDVIVGGIVGSLVNKIR